MSAAVPPLSPHEKARSLGINRVLLYGRGLGLSAESCLSLAAESLRRTADGAGPEEILSAMRLILEERAAASPPAAGAGAPVRAAPPLNRRSMVSERKGGQPFRIWAGARLAGAGKAIACMAVPWKNARRDDES